jgi:medium-chain acyl-[acyl-carrier-protein] hydrolase
MGSKVAGESGVTGRSGRLGCVCGTCRLTSPNPYWREPKGHRVTSDRDWFVPLSGAGGRLLLAFGHAGAGCAQFAELARCVAPDVQVWSANLPGRQARLDEPPRTDLDALAGELADAATTVLPGRPYDMLGYCAGALTALLVARALRERGAAPPRRLIVVSAEAPDIAWRHRRLADQPSDRLWELLAQQGGVPTAMAADERMRSVAESAIRADFAMIARYRLRPDPPLASPITVCHGRGDATPRGALLGWRRQSTAPPLLRELPGGHWLLDDSCAELAKVILAQDGQ